MLTIRVDQWSSDELPRLIARTSSGHCVTFADPMALLAACDLAEANIEHLIFE